MSPGHNFVIRGGAVMPFTCFFGARMQTENLNVFRRPFS